MPVVDVLLLALSTRPCLRVLQAVRAAALDFQFNLVVSSAGMAYQTLRWLVASLTPSAADAEYLAASGQLGAGNPSDSVTAPAPAAVAAAQQQGHAADAVAADGGWQPAPVLETVQDAIIATLLRVRC